VVDLILVVAITLAVAILAGALMFWGLSHS